MLDIPSLLNKCLFMYKEAIQSRNIYDLKIVYSILMYIQTKETILQKKIQDILPTILTEIENIKRETNDFYIHTIDFLITKYIKEQISKHLINPLSYSNLYNSSYKGILFYGVDIYTKEYIFEYIIDKIKPLNNTVVIYDTCKLNTIEDKKNIVLISELLSLSDIEKIKKITCQKKNIFLINTTPLLESISEEYKQFFECKIKIIHPDAGDIQHYIKYRLYKHLEFKHLFERKYTLHNLDMVNISKSLYESNYNYQDINDIIQKVLEISSKSCICQNIFYLSLDDTMLISRDSYIVSPYTPKFMYEKPQHFKLILNENTYLNINYCSELYFSSEDRQIKEIYIKEEDIEKKEDNIEIISLIHLPIHSEEIKEDFDPDFHISNIILNIFIYYISQIIHNKNKINKIDGMSKELQDFINLIEHNNYKLLTVQDFNEIPSKELNIIFKAFDTFIFERNEEFEFVFNKCFISYHKHFYIELEEYNETMHFEYKEKLKSLTLSKTIDIAHEISILIGELTHSKIKTEIIKQEDNYLLSIESLDEMDLTELQVYKKEEKINSVSSIIIDSNIFELDKYYTITNEKDIDLLTEKFPSEYSSIYKEDEESWKYQTIKTQEHLNYLNSQYSHRIKFYIHIFNTLILYLKKNTSILNRTKIEEAESLEYNLQMMLDYMLDITIDFEEKIWQLNWNSSSTEDNAFNDKEEEEEEVAEFNYNENIAYLHKKFYIDIHFLNKIIKLLYIKDNQSLEDIFHYHNSKIYSSNQQQDIYIRSIISMDKNKDNYYTHFHLEKLQNSNYKKELMSNIIHKLDNQKSLYFNIFQTMIDITVKYKNNTKTYIIKEKDNYLCPLLKISNNIIQNENNMSLFKLTDGLMSNIIIKWINSYSISSICSYQGKYNYTKLFMSLLLYDGYISNKKEGSVIDMINSEQYSETIINKINYIYSIKHIKYKQQNKPIFEEIKSTFECISVDDIEFKKSNQYIAGLLNTSTDNLNNFIKTYHIKKEYFDDSIFEKKYLK